MRAKTWTEEEKQILVDLYPLMGSDDSKAEFYKLSRRLGRSHSSLRKQAYRLGIAQRKGTKTRRAWEKEELELVKERAGVVPLKVLMQELGALWTKHNLPPRSRNSIDGQIHYLGQQVTTDPLDGDWFTVTVIADALRCRPSLIHQWIKDKELNKVLKAVPNGECQAPYIIKRVNLKRFFLAYPGLLDSTRPNMNWLIDIVAGKGYGH